MVTTPAKTPFKMGATKALLVMKAMRKRRKEDKTPKQKGNLKPLTPIKVPKNVG